MIHDPFDVIVIGAGPAGMMAAGQAASLGATVAILEKMPRPGRKLLLTGNKRCNLTCNRDARAFLSDCGPSGPFLRKAVGRFDPARTRAFFEALGLSIVAEPDNRCFPVTGRAEDVLMALRKYLADHHVILECGVPVSTIAPGPDGFTVTSDQRTFRARAVVIATGGCSYPGTGSTGDGYRLAKALGHHLVDPRPAEVPLIIEDPWGDELAGLSLTDAGIRGRQEPSIASARGAILFTHDGLSGPAVLDFSRLTARWQRPFEALIDLVPDQPTAELDARLARDFETHGRRSLAGILEVFAPLRLARWIALSDPSAALPAARISAIARRALVDRLKGFAVKVQGTAGFAGAVITSGGIDTREVNPSTLESRLVPGLHFAGEVLDVDGPRGGYNLGIAWATGALAGTHAAQRP